MKNTHPNFQKKIRRIAAVANMAAEDVYSLWRKYSEECRNADQSAVFSEFLDWYSTPLGGDKKGLREAVTEEAQV